MTNVSTFSGGKATFAIFAGERALATTAAMNAIDDEVYTTFCHQYAWPGALFHGKVLAMRW